MGTGITDNTMPEASNACCFMVVGYNSFWKMPLGYFFIDYLSGSDRAELVRKCLIRLHEAGVNVVSCTFDGTSSNLTIAEKLGDSLVSAKSVSEIIPYFSHPVTQERINVILDPCDMVKLIRNCFAQRRIIVDNEAKSIRWELVEKLEALQRTEGLRMGTKLTKAHIEWAKQKMKVRLLAAQVLSSSVADALYTCENELELSAFTDSGPTIKFIRIFDRLFDTLNSSSPVCRTFKAPLRTSNKNFWNSFLQEARNYIIGLCDTSNMKLIKMPRKTGFLGFVICIDSVLQLFQKLVVEQNQLNYILTYKFSQDHIEIFFSCIRRRCGCNNNSMVRQFKAAYKKLLFRNQVRSSTSANVVPESNLAVLDISYASANKTMDEIDEEIATEKICLNADFSSLSRYIETVIPYFAGFVVKKIASAFECDVCVQVLFSKSERYCLIESKTNGGLITPSKDVVEICRLTESFFRQSQKMSNNLNTVSKQKLVLSVLREAVGLNVFPASTNISGATGFLTVM